MSDTAIAELAPKIGVSRSVIQPSVPSSVVASRIITSSRKMNIGRPMLL